MNINLNFIGQFLKWPPVINYKTTSFGLAAIFGALADLMHGAATGTAPNWSADFSALVTGIGLIMAKDHNVTGGTISNVTGKPGVPISLIDVEKTL
jgi:hypothetical protein